MKQLKNKLNTSLRCSLLIMASIFLIQTACTDEEAKPKPSIATFSPASGIPGTTVTISGTGFDPAPAKNIIKFNDVTATVLTATATTITTTVPAGATSGKIEVTVNGKISQSASSFEVIPLTFSFSPASGLTGTTVTISGTGFNPTPANNVVKFNGVASPVLSATSTTLTTTVPEGATSGKIEVTANGQTIQSSLSFEVIIPLRITSFNPASGLVGTPVTISGTGFDLTAGNNFVIFNGITATVTAATATTLSTTVPTNATSGKIQVLTFGGSELATSESDFIVPVPTIETFSPLYGLPGTSLTITGTNFNDQCLACNTVKINNTMASVTAATSTQLTVTVPNTTTGAIYVDAGGQSVTSSNNFEVLIDIPRNGLVVFYPFNGNANDASGNNLHGTPVKPNVVGGVMPTLATDRFGKSNNGFNFSKGYIDCGNPTGLQITGSITISGWYKASELYPNTSYDLINKIFFDPNAGGNPKGGFMLEYYNSIGFVPSITQSFYRLTGVTMQLNNWEFITAVVDGKTYTIYKNGVKVDELTDNSGLGLNETRGNMLIGAYNSYATSAFKGMIDDITIYNRALSAAEITQLYQQTVTKY